MSKANPAPPKWATAAALLGAIAVATPLATQGSTSACSALSTHLASYSDLSQKDQARLANELREGELANQSAAECITLYWLSVVSPPVLTRTKGHT